VIEVLDTGVIPMATQTQDFDEATVASRFGLRPALKPIRITQPQGKNFSWRAASSPGRSGSSTSASSDGRGR
jgi:Cu2+-containing amine oxidase